MKGGFVNVLRGRDFFSPSASRAFQAGIALPLRQRRINSTWVLKNMKQFIFLKYPANPAQHKTAQKGGFILCVAGPACPPMLFRWHSNKRILSGDKLFLN